MEGGVQDAAGQGLSLRDIDNSIGRNQVPIILWLLGVPLTVVIILWLLHII
jgi:hypothetical protein